MRNPNLAVSLADYRTCVQAQVDFLVEYTGVAQVTPSTHADVEQCYERSVSVDGCAATLVR